MKKAFISVLSLILTAVMLISTAIPAFSLRITDTAEPLRFGSDGKLRIMHVTDTHLGTDNLEDSIWLIERACDIEKPDVIMLTGDIGYCDREETGFSIIDRLMNVFETRKIPVAVAFGNHDSESGIYTREELMAHYNTFSCSISVDEGPALTGCGTYVIPVLSSKDDSLKFNLWVFDSGDYDNEGHYANVAEDQVEWYKQKSEAIEEDYGEKINSLAFQHIIVPEIYEALEKVNFNGAYTYPNLYNKKDYYRFNESSTNFGMLTETPCCGYYNHGQFSAMAERKDVLAVFSGHDHTNAYGVRYKGIDIVNSLSTRYQGDYFSTQYGYRMIIVDENDTSTYTTYAVHWYDFFDRADMKELRKSGDDHLKTASKIRFIGFFKRLFRNIGVFFVRVFTGRTVRYPD